MRPSGMTTAFRGPHGAVRPSRILVVARDLTERAQDEAKPIGARAHLAADDAREITGSLAHELNQPLTAIVSNARAARSFSTVNPSTASSTRFCRRSPRPACGRATWTRAHLGRATSSSPQQLDPNDIVTDVERLLHSELIIRQVRLSLSLQPGLPLVSADRIQLQQVILNLSLNGMEAMHDRPVSERHLSIATSWSKAVQVAVRDIDQASTGSTWIVCSIPSSARSRPDSVSG